LVGCGLRLFSVWCGVICVVWGLVFWFGFFGCVGGGVVGLGWLVGGWLVVWGGVGVGCVWFGGGGEVWWGGGGVCVLFGFCWGGVLVWGLFFVVWGLWGLGLGGCWGGWFCLWWGSIVGFWYFYSGVVNDLFWIVRVVSSRISV
jgi:hypothetical protein